MGIAPKTSQSNSNNVRKTKVSKNEQSKFNRFLDDCFDIGMPASKYFLLGLFFVVSCYLYQNAQQEGEQAFHDAAVERWRNQQKSTSQQSSE